MTQQNEPQTTPCRYCKQPVEKGTRRCPHCGTLNPSMGVKQSLIWTVSAITILYLAAYILSYFKV